MAVRVVDLAFVGVFFPVVFLVEDLVLDWPLRAEPLVLAAAVFDLVPFLAPLAFFVDPPLAEAVLLRDEPERREEEVDPLVEVSALVLEPLRVLAEALAVVVEPVDWVFFLPVVRRAVVFVVLVGLFVLRAMERRLLFCI